VSIDRDRPFEGRSALVTGAGRGIGRAIALGLVEMGARVALLARSADELAEVAARAAELGGKSLVLPADVSNPRAVEGAVAQVIDGFEKVDILVNNAGVVWPVGPTTTFDLAEWSETININLIGVVNLTLALLPRMLEDSWGRIVNVSSGAAARPNGMIGGNAYVTSKAALEAHTLNLAAELAGTGVTVNVYRPGGVDTAMQGWIRSQPPEAVGVALHDRFAESYDQGRLISPVESAASLLRRLPSDATGAIWSVQDD
jgi:NAD(P)-dependent dehydrogenase (short-subunit alcohol dehydrogenase family)